MCLRLFFYISFLLFAQPLECVLVRGLDGPRGDSGHSGAADGGGHVRRAQHRQGGQGKQLRADEHRYLCRCHYHSHHHHLPRDSVSSYMCLRVRIFMFVRVCTHDYHIAVSIKTLDPFEIVRACVGMYSTPSPFSCHDAELLMIYFSSSFFCSYFTWVNTLSIWGCFVLYFFVTWLYLALLHSIGLLFFSLYFL